MSSKDSEHLSFVDSSNFQYLLELFMPLYQMPEYAWLPELFSIIGHERLIKLCKYCGGETIKVPTLSELLFSIEGLEWYFKSSVSNECTSAEIPPKYADIVSKISAIIEERGN